MKQAERERQPTCARVAPAMRDSEKGPPLSVILPVYNCEKYVRECLESLQSQTLEGIEVIVVNDGSTDSTSSICRSYRERWPGLRLIEKQNGGLGSARNAGLSVATGEYVGFVDSDDWVEATMYGRLYEIAKTHDCDIVLCSAYRNWSEKLPAQFRGGLFDRRQIREEIFPRLLGVLSERSGRSVLRWSNWVRIYRRRLVERCGIRFGEAFRRSQDLPFTFECTIQAERYFHLDGEYLYHNRVNPESLSRSYTKNMWELIRPLLQHLRQVVEGYKEFDFRSQMDIRVFQFAIACAENEVKPSNRASLATRLGRIDALFSDPMVQESMERIDPEDMGLRTRTYFAAFRYRLALPVLATALWRYRHQHARTNE